MIRASRRAPAGPRACTVKTVANWVNGSTPLGLAIAAIGGAGVQAGPRGLLLASGYRLRFPVASAFTVGNVILTGAPSWRDLRAQRPELLAHEERHSWQYVWCGGLPFLAAYLVCAGYSALHTGSPALRNPFEQRAGLVAGGYVDAGAAA